MILGPDFPPKPTVDEKFLKRVLELPRDDLHDIDVTVSKVEVQGARYPENLE
jgi:hypothetical protein